MEFDAGKLEKILLLLWCPGCFHSVGDADEGAGEGVKWGFLDRFTTCVPRVI